MSDTISIQSMNYHKGGFFERITENIFKNADYNVSVRNTSYGFEIDNLITKENYTIVLQNKLYEKSGISKDILYQWKAKGDQIGADRVIIAIAGQDLKQKLKNVAKALGIYLWTEEEIHTLNNMDTSQKKIDYFYLLFYIPSHLTKGGKVIFTTDLVKMAVDVKMAEKFWKDALKLLGTDCPTDTCEWCCNVTN
jgi:hypothetical protein